MSIQQDLHKKIADAKNIMLWKVKVSMQTFESGEFKNKVKGALKLKQQQAEEARLHAALEQAAPRPGGGVLHAIFG